MLAAPEYANFDTTNNVRAALAVESMKRHMTDEGWQIMLGLEHAGYKLFGHNIGGVWENAREMVASYSSMTNVKHIVDRLSPSVVVVQDKREWDVKPGDFREPQARFHNIEALKNASHIFKVTILKDAHQRQLYHEESAREMGCHAWIIYYDPDNISRLAPFVRLPHLIRTYHSLDASIVPEFNPNRTKGCLLSGALSDAYPLRQRLVREVSRLPETDYLPFPGYHMKGCQTPTYLKMLSQYKVAICTSSRYKYALRKIMEATACGCVVITDLEEPLPVIGGNLITVRSDISTAEVATITRHLVNNYDPIRQAVLAELAKDYYDYRAVGQRLANDIETMRRSYANGR